MTTVSKPSNQEVYADLASLVSGHPSANFLFPGRPFGHVFKVHCPEVGKFQVLEVLPGKVVRHVHEDAVTAAVLKFCDNLPSKDFPFYKLDAGRADKAMAYWLLSTPPITEKIYPVLQKSTDGYTFQRLPFDLSATETPLFDDFLAHMTSNVPAFLAYVGALFDADAPRQNYLWVWGEGGDGKGVFCRFLRRCFADAYVALSSDSRNINQFFTARLMGKRIGIFQDCHSPKFVQSELFMMLSGGDPVFVEQKGKDGYTTDIDTMFIFSSNLEPDITGSKAHRRRAIVCGMRERTEYNGAKNTYEARLWIEAPGILHKCVEAWRQMKTEHGEIVVDGSATDRIVENSEEIFEHVLSEYFHINKEKTTEGIKCADLAGQLTKQLHWRSHEVGRFKDYLKRRGILQARLDRGGPRYYPTLFPKVERQF